jgi:hypothetical protein
MKHILQFFLAAFGMVVFMASCDKVDDLPFYADGTTPALSASTNRVAVQPVDASAPAIAFSWTDPKHSTSFDNYKFVLEFDSLGRNFSRPQSRIVYGALSDTLTGSELNDILLSLGFDFNVEYDVEIRVTSSYGNNNERLTSAPIVVKMTPYLIPPKVTPPTSGTLFLVGSATGGGWNNPVPVPTQEFAKISNTLYVGVFDLSGGNEYLMLPVNGDWSNKYSVQDKTVPGLNAGGDFGFNLPDNFPGPATSGTYKITVDFQSGRFSCVPYTGARVPSNLFMVGDATPGGWSNPVPTPSQKFAQLNSVQFELTLALTGGRQYLFLPVNGDWSNKYAVANNTLPGLSNGGYFGYNLGDNFPGPATDGNYKIEVNFGVQDPAAPSNTAWFKTTRL